MEFAHEIATSQGVWVILCIILAVSLIRELPKENVAREAAQTRQHEIYRVEPQRREERSITH